MGPHRARRTATTIVLLLLLGALLPVAPAAAQTPPPNDDIANATVVGMPWSEGFDASGATSAPDDPACGPGGPSVWYAYTAERDGDVFALADSWERPSWLFVASGAPGALEEIACVPGGEQVNVPVTEGTTYYVMVALDPGTPEGWVDVSLWPSLAVDLRVDDTGVHSVHGQAVVSGTVTCSWPSWVYLSGWARQLVFGRLFISAPFEAQLSCDGATRWTATTELEQANGVFRSGATTVSAAAWACAFDCVEAHLTTSVRLRPTRGTPRRPALQTPTSRRIGSMAK